MKNIPIVIVVLALAASLAGCAQAATAVASTPDTTGAIPATGFVTALAGKPPVDMRSGPTSNFGVVGQIKSGDSAQLVGINAAGDWLLVSYQGKVGWVAAASVDYTLAQ